jgi:hypothetical protein
MTPPLTAAGFESPSLAGGARTAYELKFLLDEAVALEVESWPRLEDRISGPVVSSRLSVHGGGVRRMFMTGVTP